MQWTPNLISDWSKKVMPNLTFDSQKLKMREEYEEYITASKNNKIEEYADMVIVAIILKIRFGSDFGYNFINRYRYSYEKVWKAVNKKMNKNVHRRWNFTNGVYHHF